MLERIVEAMLKGLREEEDVMGVELVTGSLIKTPKLPANHAKFPIPAGVRAFWVITKDRKHHMVKIGE